MSDLLRKLAPGAVFIPHHTDPQKRFAVGAGSELARVLAIPRRPALDLNSTRAGAIVALITERLRIENKACKCAYLGVRCIDTLKPAQAWALYEAAISQGLVGAIGVGHGKTGLDLLAPMVLPGCKLAVLLIPPGLRDQIVRDYEVWSQHFDTPSIRVDSFGKIKPGKPVLHVLTYSKFSRADATALLDSLSPDLIIVDEAQKLRHKDTATTSRVLRYLVAHPTTRLCAWSGTLTAKSIKDYAHLSAFALKDKSPLPLDPHAVEEWSLALDPSDNQAPAGALEALCKPGEDLYSGFHRRLRDTLGFVSTKAGSVDASLYLFERKAPPIPPEITKELQKLRNSWLRPDGEELIDAMSVAKSARELACGFYYRWRFPRGESDSLITRWLEARKAWHKELREKLRARKEHLDSPLLCAKAAQRAYSETPYDGPLPVWRSDTYLPWLEIAGQVQPETEAVWLSEYLAADCAQWLKKHRGIVWYEHSAFGARVAKLSGCPLHAGGAHAEARILAETGSRSLVCSIKAHGTGRDGLQRLFDTQLIANPPTSGALWEQLLGRLHRIGQQSDEVTSYVYRHTPEFAEGIDRAILQAKYIEGTLGGLQKLLSASYDFGLSLRLSDALKKAPESEHESALFDGVPLV